MNYFLSLPLLIMPITLWINTIISLKTNNHDLDLILLIISLVAICFHIVWSIVLILKKDEYFAPLTVNLKVKLFLFPLYFIIITLGIAYFVASPFIIMITQKETLLVYGVIYAVLAVVLLFLITSILQFFCLIKIYKKDVFSKSEIIIYLIGSWIFIVSFIVGQIAFIRFVIYTKNMTNAAKMMEESGVQQE